MYHISIERQIKRLSYDMNTIRMDKRIPLKIKLEINFFFFP